MLTPEERKDRAKWSRILKVYGLTKEQYQELDLGSCPICLRGWSEIVRPVIDHNHVEKYTRGLVCRFCNHRRIGHHRDSALLRRIADYLDQAESRKNIKMPVKIKKKRKKK